MAIGMNRIGQPVGGQTIGQSFQKQGIFSGSNQIDTHFNPAVTQIPGGPIRNALDGLGSTPLIEPKASDGLPHGVPSVQEFFSTATPKRIAEYIVHVSVGRSFPHFELLPPRQASEDEIAGFSVGTLKFGTQLPTELPEGVSPRTISHKYESKFVRHTRFGQAFRCTRDVLMTEKGKALKANYILALASNSVTLGQITITSALLRCKDVYRPYRQKYLAPGTFAEDTMAQRIMNAVGLLHRKADAVYELINFVRELGTRLESDAFTHALCTNTLFGLLAYGSQKETQYNLRGPAAPRILEQGGDYFRANGVHGIKFVEEPEYNFVRSGREGRNKMNMLKRIIEVGRHYFLTSESIVSREEDVTLRQSADLAFLNIDAQDGVIQTQPYLDILDACAAFDPNSTALSPIYNKLVRDKGQRIKTIAKEVGARCPDFDSGGRIDPFINWTPKSDPKIVNFLGEQDLYYTSKDDQAMIVSKAVKSLKKAVTQKELESIQVMLNKAEEWHDPLDIRYTEAFLYATYATNRVTGNETFKAMTRLPNTAVHRGIIYLSVNNQQHGIICENISSPGLLSLVEKGSYGMKSIPLSSIAQETKLKMDLLQIADNPAKTQRVDDISKMLKTIAAARDLVPDFTTQGNLSAAIRGRSRVHTSINANHAGDIPPSANDLPENFGIPVVIDLLPGFSRYQNMEAIARAPVTPLVSSSLHKHIQRGVGALEAMMGLLTSCFSSPVAPNYYFNQNSIHFDQSSIRGTKSMNPARCTGASNIFFGKRYECAFQTSYGDYNFPPDSIEKTVVATAANTQVGIHEENHGLNTITEFLTGSRVTKTKLLSQFDGNGQNANGIVANVAAAAPAGQALAQRYRDVGFSYGRGLQYVLQGAPEFIDYDRSNHHVSYNRRAHALYCEVSLTSYLGNAASLVRDRAGMNGVRAAVGGGGGGGVGVLGGAPVALVNVQASDRTELPPPVKALLHTLTGLNNMGHLDIGAQDANELQFAKRLVRGIIFGRGSVLSGATREHLDHYGAIPGANALPAFKAGAAIPAVPASPFAPHNTSYSQAFFALYSKLRELHPADIGIPQSVSRNHMAMARSIFFFLEDTADKLNLHTLAESAQQVSHLYQAEKAKIEFAAWGEGVERQIREAQEEVESRPLQNQGGAPIDPLSVHAIAHGAPGNIFGQGLDNNVCIQFGVSIANTYFERVRNEMRGLVSATGIDDAMLTRWDRLNNIAGSMAAMPNMPNRGLGIVEANCELAMAHSDTVFPIVARYLTAMKHVGEGFSHLRPSSKTSLDSGIWSGVAGRNPSRTFLTNFCLIPSIAAQAPMANHENSSFIDDIPLSLTIEEFQEKIRSEMAGKGLTNMNGKRRRGGDPRAGFTSSGAGLFNLGDPDDQDFHNPSSFAYPVHNDAPNQDGRSEMALQSRNDRGEAAKRARRNVYGQARPTHDAQGKPISYTLESAIVPDFGNAWWGERMITEAYGSGASVLLTTAVNMAYCGTRVDKGIFGQMYRNNIPPPIGFLCVDMFIRLITSALVFVATAGSTGHLSWCLPDFSHAYDADRKMDNFTLTFQMAAHVFRSENVLIMPDVVFEGYCGGGDGRLIRSGFGDLDARNSDVSTFMNVKRLDIDFNYKTRERRGNRFVFALGFSKRRVDFPDYLCLAGTILDPNVGLAHFIPQDMVASAKNGQVHLSFDSATLALEKFKFHMGKRGGATQHENAPYVEERNLLKTGNTITAIADQWGYCRATGEYTNKLTTGQGPLGSLGPGSTEALRGGASTLERIKSRCGGNTMAC